MTKSNLLTVLMMGLLAACAPQGHQALEVIADQAVQNIACKNQNLEAQLWDGLKEFLLEEKVLPQAADLSQALHAQVEQLASKNSQMTREDVESLTSQLDTLVTTLLSEAPQGERVTTSEELLQLLSAMDVGDRTTVFRSYMQDKVRSQFTTLQKTVQSYDLNCDAGSGDYASREPASDVPALGVNRDYEYHKAQALKNGLSLAAFGGRWAMTTAYQSCQVTQLPALTAATPALKGISIVGTHTDKIGSKRAISSLSQLQSTHTYIKDVSSYGAGCFNVKNNPLIYDYGGKPYATTAATSELNFFKNSGTGEAVLGFDCSGYVFSSLATAGLRLQKGRALKAVDTYSWGSGTYVEPQKNGLTCLDKITVSAKSTIKAGDVIAIYGHVMMVDKVGADPFGISKIKTVADCSKLTSNDFDFVIGQSSNSKSGIGLNFYQAKDYMLTSDKFKTGLEKYAHAACVASFNNTSSTPNVGTLSVVRHNGTAECMAPRVKLAQEACIQSCDSLSR